MVDNEPVEIQGEKLAKGDVMDKKYSIAKGLIKSIRPAVLGGSAAVVASNAVAGETDIPTAAIISVATWAFSMFVNWFKNR